MTVRDGKRFFRCLCFSFFTFFLRYYILHVLGRMRCLESNRLDKQIRQSFRIVFSKILGIFQKKKRPKIKVKNRKIINKRRAKTNFSKNSRLFQPWFPRKKNNFNTKTVGASTTFAAQFQKIASKMLKILRGLLLIVGELFFRKNALLNWKSIIYLNLVLV